MRRRYKQYRFIITVCFNAVLFYLLYFWLRRNIDLHGLLIDVQQVKTSSICAVFVLYLFVFAIYSLRLASLLRIEPSKAAYIVGIGNGLNNLLPFRLGDVLRVYFAKRTFSVDVSRTISATFVERYFDLILLLLFGAFILLDQNFNFEVNSCYLFLILLSCSLLSIVLYRYLIVKDGQLKSWLHQFKHICLLLNSLEDIVVNSSKLRTLTLSFAIWLCILTLYYIFFRSNVGSAFTLGGAVFILFTTTLSFAIPYSFAGIGIFETATVYYLIKYLHLVPTKALALALVFHFASALPQFLVMAVMLGIHHVALVGPIKAWREELRNS